MSCIVANSNLNKSIIKQTFENLSYGPAPESDKVANAWLEEHGRSFGHFINNEWHTPEGRSKYESKNPATGEVIASTLQGTKEDVDMAVEVAKKAYEDWSSRAPHYRATMLYNLARHIQKHSQLFAVLESVDNGKSFRETRDADVSVVVRHLYHHAGWASLMETEMREWTSIGVVGAIVPWNFPLMLLVWKVAGALAMGNVVVMKPASYTRLTCLLFADVCRQAGLPPGVFQVLTGPGSMGSLLASHPDVAKVAFTGSTEVGQLLRRSLAGLGKKLSLELGGKSPVVVFEDADLDSVVEGVVQAVWFNQGQVCSAGSRLLVQESVYHDLLLKIKQKMATLRIGRGLDKCVDMSAVVDGAHLQSIKDMVNQAKLEGAEVYQATEVPTLGCFYPPTLVTNVQTTSKIVLEEVFGPVLVAMSFRTPQEAVSLANNSVYGLGASVWTEKLSLALEVAMMIKAGSVWVNGHNMFDAAAGFGGYKMSGYGRDGGKEGLYEYVRLKGSSMVRPCAADISDFALQPPSPLPFSPLLSQETSLSIDSTYKLYYGGKQHRPDSNYSKPLGNKLLPQGNRKDIRNAVEAASKALPGWSRRAGHNKAQILYYIAENLQQRRAEVVQCLEDHSHLDNAKANHEFDVAIRRIFHWAAYADKCGGRVQETTLYGATVQVNEPVGVVAMVCPPSPSLLAFVSLFSAAISRSNCVVIVPSEQNPLPAFMMYQIFDTSDLPPGVVNIISGPQDHLTRCLAEHRNVQALWYFGMTAQASKLVEHASADNMKRLWLDGGVTRDWMDDRIGCGEEFLYHANQVKNIWLPMGDTHSL